MRPHVILRLPGDEHVQLLVLAVVVLGVLANALLHAAPPANGNLAVGLALHALLRVAARANDEACKECKHESAWLAHASGCTPKVQSAESALLQLSPSCAGTLADSMRGRCNMQQAYIAPMKLYPGYSLMGM
jgi:hypothetical protein